MLEEEFGTLWTRLDVTEKELHKMLPRLDELEAKCLFQRERHLLPVRLRNIPGGIDQPVRYKL